MQMYAKAPWHYAAKKDGSKPVCPSKDMYCYFLNLTSCEPDPGKKYERLLDGYKAQRPGDTLMRRRKRGYWLLEYATRPKTWLRRQLYLYSKGLVNITRPCSVVHVRRSDVVLHESDARRYRKIDDYVEALVPKGSRATAETKNIFLLTDDANAVGEALHKYPEYTWMYIDRPRHKGTSGGWENQIPSDDPKLEVLVLLSTFRLVRQCSALIRTDGNFADLLAAEMRHGYGSVNMQDGGDGGSFRHVNLDEGDPNAWSAANAVTVNVSIDYMHGCLEESVGCNSRFECCNHLGCSAASNRTCQKCLQADDKCRDSDECCRTLKCNGGRCGPMR